MDVRLPDGTIIKNVPDGTTKADLVQKLQRNGMAVPAEWLQPAASAPSAQPPAVVQAGDSLRQISRQVGLFVRHGVEGLGQLADVVTEPIRVGVVNPIARLVGAPQATESTGQAVSRLADTVGLPKPENATERVVGDASRMVAGSIGMGSGSLAAASKSTAPVVKAALTQMAARPGVQAVGAATSGASGGAVREAGGNEWEQLAASIMGGVAGGVTADKLTKAATATGNAIRNLVTPKATELARADQQISMTLERSGIDWSGVPERIKQAMREDVASALSNGQPLNADSLRRLLVFRRAGVTPTVGQLTQDPGQITREVNLAKAGANSTDPALQRLPALQNQNTRTLLQRLDDSGAANAPDAMGAGTRAVDSLNNVVGRNQAEIGELYQRARDTNGRSLPLEGGTFTARANQLLDDANVGSFLPADIAKKMNSIASGEYPLTVDVAEQLKTSMGNISRNSADGNVRTALRLVRQALDDAPLQNGKTFNPGNVPAVNGSVPPSTAAAGEESIAAFNAARRANREWMQRVERNPALQAVVDGVEPDQFIQRYVVGKGASAANVRALRDELDPQAAEQLRSYMVRYLRDKATGGDADITKFSGKAYRDALRDLNDKLPAFFSEDEIQHLQDLGNAAKYMQSQPAGSAVNNSNSGALLIGKGLDILDRAAGYVPLGGKDVIKGVIQGAQQRQVLAPRNALQTAAQLPPPAKINPLLAAAAASPANGSQDDRRH